MSLIKKIQTPQLRYGLVSDKFPDDVNALDTHFVNSHSSVLMFEVSTLQEQNHQTAYEDFMYIYSYHVEHIV